jgi:hypothetical protein
VRTGDYLSAALRARSSITRYSPARPVNLHRFYEQVVRPGLEALPEPARLEFGTADFLDLRRAAAQVDDYAGNEAAKAYKIAIPAGLPL